MFFGVFPGVPGHGGVGFAVYSVSDKPLMLPEGVCDGVVPLLKTSRS
jgi:hypothetical protein